MLFRFFFLWWCILFILCLDVFCFRFSVWGCHVIPYLSQTNASFPNILLDIGKLSQSPAAQPVTYLSSNVSSRQWGQSHQQCQPVMYRSFFPIFLSHNFFFHFRLCKKCLINVSSSQYESISPRQLDKIVITHQRGHLTLTDEKNASCLRSTFLYLLFLI